ncbi:WW domain-binding protein 2-like [Dermacentor albipictus]|uniref:WW domain-binding protein 2-like n=1 Tax=Dermacentor albipictus TaxID=60249 RepID=UPI0031FC159A
MSLNTSHASNGILLFTGELILIYCDNVEVTFEGPDAAKFRGAKKGRLYLTTHRVVFINTNQLDFLKSFSFPFVNMSNLGLEQPIFGANYIRGKVRAEENGNWTGTCSFKLRFMKGGSVEFGQAMMAASKLASQRRAQAAVLPCPLPMGPFQLLAPDVYMPAGNANYGFVLPSHVFPQAPPANTVFAYNVPPPYPGIYPRDQASTSYAPPSVTEEFKRSAQPPPPGVKSSASHPEQSGKEADETPGAHAQAPGFKGSSSKESRD